MKRIIMKRIFIFLAMAGLLSTTACEDEVEKAATDGEIEASKSWFNTDNLPEPPSPNVDNIWEFGEEFSAGETIVKSSNDEYIIRVAADENRLELCKRNGITYKMINYRHVSSGDPSKDNEVCGSPSYLADESGITGYVSDLQHPTLDHVDWACMPKKLYLSVMNGMVDYVDGGYRLKNNGSLVLRYIKDGELTGGTIFEDPDLGISNTIMVDSQMGFPYFNFNSGETILQSKNLQWILRVGVNGKLEICNLINHKWSVVSQFGQVLNEDTEPAVRIFGGPDGHYMYSYIIQGGVLMNSNSSKYYVVNPDYIEDAYHLNDKLGYAFTLSNSGKVKRKIIDTITGEVLSVQVALK